MFFEWFLENVKNLIIVAFEKSHNLTSLLNHSEVTILKILSIESNIIINKQITLYKLVFLISFCIVVSLLGCNSYNGDKISTGIVEYSISYPHAKAGEISTAILPRKMVMKFTENYSLNRIEGFMGVFLLSNIADYKHDKNTTLIKFFDNKFYHEGEKMKPPCFFSEIKDAKVQFTPLKKQIAGFECSHAIVSFPEMGIDTFSVFYTPAIGISNPNKTNPFNKIDGTLMEYNIVMKGIIMMVKADTFYSAEIAHKEFEVPEKYAPVSAVKMDEIINALLTN